MLLISVCFYLQIVNKLPYNLKFLNYIFLEQNEQSNVFDGIPVTKRPKKKIPKILDGTFYTLDAEIGLDGKISAKCNECKEIRKGNISSTGNFKSHYKKHPERLAKLEEYLKQEDNCHGVDLDRSKQPRMEDILTPVSEEKVI